MGDGMKPISPPRGDKKERNFGDGNSSSSMFDGSRVSLGRWYSIKDSLNFDPSQSLYP